jgi:hypothetical protein
MEQNVKQFLQNILKCDKKIHFQCCGAADVAGPSHFHLPGLGWIRPMKKIRSGYGSALLKTV